MRIHIVTIFPELFDVPLQMGVIGRAIRAGIASTQVHDLRIFGIGKTRSVDDSPFGGDPGMIMRPGPVANCVRSLGLPSSSPIIALTPAGKLFSQREAERLAAQPIITLICGRYDGMDERINSSIATEELSIGDYVLSGGEIAGLAIIDAVIRLQEDALGHSKEALEDDSHTSGLLQHPQYKRPADFEGDEVPPVLLSGDHAAIAKWRREQSLKRTLDRRPDLLSSANLTKSDRAYLDQIGWKQS